MLDRDEEKHLISTLWATGNRSSPDPVSSCISPPSLLQYNSVLTSSCRHLECHPHNHNPDCIDYRKYSIPDQHSDPIYYIFYDFFLRHIILSLLYDICMAHYTMTFMTFLWHTKLWHVFIIFLWRRPAMTFFLTYYTKSCIVVVFLWPTMWFSTRGPGIPPGSLREFQGSNYFWPLGAVETSCKHDTDIS